MNWSSSINDYIFIERLGRQSNDTWYGGNSGVYRARLTQQAQARSTSLMVANEFVLKVLLNIDSISAHDLALEVFDPSLALPCLLIIIHAVFVFLHSMAM